MSKRGIYANDSYEKRKKAALKGFMNKSNKAKRASLANLKLKPKTHSEKTKRIIGEKSRARYKRALKDGSEFERRKKISKTEKKVRKTAQAKIWLAEAGKKISKTKLNWSAKKKAQVYSENMRTKISKWSSNYWDSLTDKQRNAKLKKFMQAPIHRALPNRVEQNVRNLKIRGVHFTGDGKYWVSFNDTLVKHKNPDFIIKQFKTQRRVKAVLEIMDFKYWHTKEEARKIKSLYKKARIRCLIIDAKMCYSKTNLQKVRKSIETFISNL